MTTPTSAGAPPGAPETSPALLADVLAGRVSIGAALGMTAKDLEGLVDLGKAHLRAGRKTDARAVFDGLCALEPKAASFHTLAGMAAEACGDFAGADASFTAAIECGGDDVRGPAYLARALVRMRFAQEKEALADFALASDLCDPKDPVVQATLRTMGARCAQLVEQREGG